MQSSRENASLLFLLNIYVSTKYQRPPAIGEKRASLKVEYRHPQIIRRLREDEKNWLRKTDRQTDIGSVLHLSLSTYENKNLRPTQQTAYLKMSM